MIQINKTQATEYVKGLVDSYFVYNEDPMSIDDIDDLCCITFEGEEVCETDAVFYTLYGMLPLIFDDIITYIEENHIIEEDVWGTYAMREGIGLCD